MQRLGRDGKFDIFSLVSFLTIGANVNAKIIFVVVSFHLLYMTSTSTSIGVQNISKDFILCVLQLHFNSCFNNDIISNNAVIHKLD